MEQADVIVIGSGQGGVPLATDLAREGREVAMFERGAWGGTCINFGCTPSKAFLASAHVAGGRRRAEELGVHIEPEVDFPAVMHRIRDMTASWSDGIVDRLRGAGVRMIKAEAAFSGERTVTGGGVTVQAPLVIVNTGKSPRIPEISGLADTPYLTYVSFWNVEDMPQRAIVLGAGYTGIELGQGLARLGVRTHIVDTAARPASKEEIEVSKALGEALWEDGVQFHLSTQLEKASYAHGSFTLSSDDREILRGDMLLVATGRKPNTEHLNAQASGIELDEQGHIKVDKHFRTSCEGVYAIGDVTGQPAFTHVSWEDYRRLKAILSGQEREQGDRVLGYAFFTDPQVGRAGLTLEQAEAQGYNARAATLQLEEVARASETGNTLGFYRMVVDRDTDRILGATLVSPAAAELVHVFVALMEAGATWQTLARSVHIHPTYAEGLQSLAMQLQNE